LKALFFTEPIASAESLVELDAVLYCKKFDLLLNCNERRNFIDNLRRKAHLYGVQTVEAFQIEPRCRDFSDNRLLAMALASEPDALVSSDEDLLTLHPWRGIPIITPAEFLARFPQPAAE